MLIKAVVSWLDKIGFILSCLCLLFITVATTYEVIARYVFNKPTTWSLEISAFLFLGMVCLAAGRIQEDNTHIKMEFLTSLLPARATPFSRLFTYIIGLAFCSIVVWKSWQYALQAFNGGFRSSSVLGALLYPFIFLMVIGFAFCALQNLVQIVSTVPDLFKRQSQGNPSPKNSTDPTGVFN
jgi:TRAP-type C4-dicarboxylate transport system permease small subunit